MPCPKSFDNQRQSIGKTMDNYYHEEEIPEAQLRAMERDRRWRDEFLSDPLLQEQEDDEELPEWFLSELLDLEFDGDVVPGERVAGADRGSAGGDSQSG